MSDFDVLAVCMCFLFVAMMILIGSTHGFERRLAELECHADFMDKYVARREKSEKNE